jgi:hypothetical protein
MSKCEYVYRFGLYDQEGNLMMETEVDAPDPTIDLQFWEEFMGGDCWIKYHGEFTEEKENE